MTTSLADLAGSKGGYYDRTDPQNNFDKHVFIAGRILQSAEMNEIQTNQQNQLRGIADALFKDGDIVRDARVAVDTQTSQATLESGAVYLRGQVRGVGEALLTIPPTGTIAIGIWLVTDVVTDQDDKSLLDPAAGNRGFNEPGAYRLRSLPHWGLETDTVANGEFFPVYYIDNGTLRAKEPPPNLDAVTQAIARYDVDSNGSNYIINGFRVTRLEDITRDQQVYSIASGRARVNGFGLMTNAASRFVFDSHPDTRDVKGEEYAPSAADPTTKKQRVKTRYFPIFKIGDVSITKEVSAQFDRRGTNADELQMQNDYSLQKIVSLKSGTKVLVQGTDWNLDGDRRHINWLNPTSPAMNSTIDIVYQVKTQYVVDPADIDDTGFYVKDAVVAPPGDTSTSVTVDYSYKLPRVDRLCFNEQGKFVVIKGIATDVNPVAAPVPSNLLSLCQIHQTWTANFEETKIENDGVRMVSMSELEKMNNRLDDLTDMMAQINLISDINIRDNSKKLGLFVDPFVNDLQRDEGILDQTAAIAGNCLQLPIKGTPLEPVPVNGIGGITDTVSCDFVEEVLLGNTARTSNMKVNPYMAFAAFPAQVTLSPQIDRWVDTKTAWASPETRYFTTTVYAPWSFMGGVHGTTRQTGQVQTNELASTSSVDAEFLRPIEVKFSITGFIPGETLSEVKFDAVVVQPTAI
ncbi:DUF4815 domain-containing protein [Salmonella enterica]|nr:DUF4815 domain-containing protein [Salmonella enterica]